MVQVNIPQPQNVEIKTLKLHLKVRDCFDATFLNEHGNTVLDYSGYVPDFMPGDHYGDYVILDIDIDTGKVINWQVPTKEQLESLINKEDDED